MRSPSKWRLNQISEIREFTWRENSGWRYKGKPPPYRNKNSNIQIKKRRFGTSLAVQWLRLHASTARSLGLIPGQGTKISHAKWQEQKKKNFLNWVKMKMQHIKKKNKREKGWGLRLVCVSMLNRVWLCATPWTAALQAPLSREISRQGYWIRLPFLPSRSLPSLCCC